jgi:hypothetical protein
MLDKFPKGTILNIVVVFPGEYRIGWEYDGKVYVPGIGSYYDFETAIRKAWGVFQEEMKASE